MTRGVLRVEASHEPGYFDLVHSHYWLSGQVGSLAAERWQVPLVHSMHTMAKVKNAALAEGDAPEPTARVIGEEQVVELADRLIANTPAEAAQLVELYGADPDKVVPVFPGVDLDLFSPGRSGARGEGPRGARAAGRRPGPAVRRPDPAAQGARRPAARRRPSASPTTRPCASGSSSPSSAGRPGPGSRTRPIWPTSPADLGIADLVRFAPPVAQTELVDWYRAADLAVVPSYNESFGLVALEAQACGTPVVAAAVGGLLTAVADGRSRPAGRRPRPVVLGRRARRPARRTGPPRGAGRRRGAARGGLRLAGDRRRRARRLRRGRVGPPAAVPGGQRSRLAVTADRSAELDRLIAGVLDERALVYQHPHQGAFFVSLPGTHKLLTNTWLVVGDHSLLVEAFVVRHPDENHAAF